MVFLNFFSHFLFKTNIFNFLLIFDEKFSERFVGALDNLMSEFTMWRFTLEMDITRIKLSRCFPYLFELKLFSVARIFQKAITKLSLQSNGKIHWNPLTNSLADYYPKLETVFLNRNDNKSSRMLACLFGIQNEILCFLIHIYLLLRLCCFSRWAKTIIHFGSYTFFIRLQQMLLIAIFLGIHVFFTKPFILVFLFLYSVLIMT